MTREEHIARAMLLGLVYDPNDHTYYKIKSDPTDRTEVILDADTLENLQPGYFNRGTNEPMNPWNTRKHMVLEGKIGCEP